MVERAVRNILPIFRLQLSKSPHLGVCIPRDPGGDAS
jgi:hypothetical protein